MQYLYVLLSGPDISIYLIIIYQMKLTLHMEHSGRFTTMVTTNVESCVQHWF